MGNTKTIKSKTRAGRPLGTSNIRERILDAALNNLANKGAEGTTISAIAKDCSVTNAVVHYYFKNKEELFLKIIEELILPKVYSVWGAVDENYESSCDLIGEVISRATAMIGENPLILQIWIREVLVNKGIFFSAFIKNLPREKIMKLAALMSKEQKEGKINPDIVPEAMVTSVMTSVMVTFVVAPIILADADKNAVIKHVKSLIINGLKAH